MKRILLYFVLAVQVVGLISLYASHSVGRELIGYRLKTRPVDPRDLLRGDYVILSYDISALPKEWDPEDFPNGRAYVTLEPDGEFWKIASVSTERSGANQPILAATVRGHTLIYDIEKYFVPEGRGNPPLPITVEIVVRDGGKAQIRQLFAEGKPWPPRG